MTFATNRKASISRRKACSIPGRSTLTATVLPSGVTALCTCAIEAAAMAGLNSVNNSSTGAPSSSATMRRASASSKGGTRSCSERSSAAISAPTTSGRVESIWPSFTSAGPSAVKARAMGGRSGSPFLPKGRSTIAAARRANRVRFPSDGTAQMQASAPDRAIVPPIRSSRHRWAGTCSRLMSDHIRPGHRPGTSPIAPGTSRPRVDARGRGKGRS